MTSAAAVATPRHLLSLHHLLDPLVLADPYPLYRELREAGPVTWDPYLHVWTVTGYAEVLEVLQTFSATRTPTPEQFHAMGMSELEPVSAVMVRQMLFMDAPQHTRLRAVCSAVFTPRKVEQVEHRVREISDELLANVADAGKWDLLADYAEPLPAIVTIELLGLPGEDWRRIKAWSETFAGLLGNFQHSPDQARAILEAVEQLTDYVRREVMAQRAAPRAGLISNLLAQGADGLEDEQIVANIIVTLVGGLETTTNLIAGGFLTLLAEPAARARLKAHPELMESAVEELLRYESPSQHTGRIAPRDTILGGHRIARGDAVMAVMAAANRDPTVFVDPDRLDIARTPNRHLAFAWGPHFCFGAPLARLEARIAFDALLEMADTIHLTGERLEWRENLGLRGLTALPVVMESGHSA